MFAKSARIAATSKLLSRPPHPVLCCGLRFPSFVVCSHRLIWAARPQAVHDARAPFVWQISQPGAWSSSFALRRTDWNSFWFFLNRVDFARIAVTFRFRFDFCFCMSRYFSCTLLPLHATDFVHSWVRVRDCVVLMLVVHHSFHCSSCACRKL